MIAKYVNRISDVFLKFSNLKICLKALYERFKKILGVKMPESLNANL